jgi:hypothetical protein
MGSLTRSAVRRPGRTLLRRQLPRSWSCAPSGRLPEQGDKVRRLMGEHHHDLESQYPRLVLNNNSKQTHETKPRNCGVDKRHL